MELKEFIATSLVQIVKGIQSAQQQIGSENSVISPPVVTLNQHGPYQGIQVSEDKFVTPACIKFDVAVTVEDRSGGEGGASIKVASLFKAQGGLSASSTSTSASRIQFEVPVILPTPANFKKLVTPLAFTLTR